MQVSIQQKKRQKNILISRAANTNVKNGSALFSDLLVRELVRTNRVCRIQIRVDGLTADFKRPIAGDLRLETYAIRNRGKRLTLNG